MDNEQKLLWASISVIVITHAIMLVSGLSQNQMTGHALINLVAIGIIIGILKK